MRERGFIDTLCCTASHRDTTVSAAGLCILYMCALDVMRVRVFVK